MRELVDSLLGEAKNLSQDTSNLQCNYRQSFDYSKNFHEAYIATRLTGTYAVAKRVLQELVSLTGVSPSSCLDVGAGPGTGILAASDIFSDCKDFISIEQDKIFIEWAQKFHAAKAIQNVDYICGDYTNLGWPCASAIYMGYTLGETKDTESVLQKALSSARDFVVITEPGTPRGFNVIRSAREFFTLRGWFVIAPCTGQGACPIMPEHSTNWCHFNERVERSIAGQKAKKGVMGFEDEKYSYIILSQKPFDPPSPSRIVAKPLKRSGHIIMDTCIHCKLERRTISKSNAAYKQATKCKWGDLI